MRSKRPVRLRTLIVRASLLTGILALATTVVGLLLGLNGVGVVLVREAVEAMGRGVPGALCAQDPRGWRQVTPDGGVVAFLDRATAGADPAMVPEVMAALAAGATDFMGRVEGGGRAIAVVLRPAGPCSLYYHRWQPKAAVWRLVAWVLPLALALVAALAALLGNRLIARPLRARLEALERAAGRVGMEGGQPEAGTGDVAELVAVGRVIDAAHLRVVADRAEQRARQQALEDHLAALAHDTNTPLTSLFMALESLDFLESQRDLGRKPLAGEGRTLVEAALGDVVYLASLIQNLALDRRFADGRAAGMVADLSAAGTTAFDLRAVVDRVVGRGARLGRARRVAVDGAWPDEPVRVRGQAVLVEQALMNLVQNAVEHGAARTTPPVGGEGVGGGQVLVVLEASAGTGAGGRFALWVSDDGPGAEPSEVARLTERGYRTADSRARRPAGSGLGLSTARAVCEAHGWQLKLTGRGPHGGLHLEISGGVDSV